MRNQAELLFNGGPQALSALSSERLGGTGHEQRAKDRFQESLCVERVIEYFFPGIVLEAKGATASWRNNRKM